MEIFNKSIPQQLMAQFRADDEDLDAYANHLINQTEKKQVLNWIDSLNNADFSALLTPFVAGHLREKIGDEESFVEGKDKGE
ncbi:hypothetical protein ACFFIX_23000 [Metabacillus herbersteinensis]|uniref:Uncharacterized protein n=1 Tax=Metabacillus herbersteinensis TaxID=283816 RepID=A0ABV6GLC6_9BACI